MFHEKIHFNFYFFSSKITFFMKKYTLTIMVAAIILTFKCGRIFHLRRCLLKIHCLYNCGGHFDQWTEQFLLWICLVSLFHVCLCYAVLSVPFSFVGTCWERADRLACVLCFLVFCHFSICVFIHIRTKAEVGTV